MYPVFATPPPFRLLLFRIDTLLIEVIPLLPVSITPIAAIITLHFSEWELSLVGGIRCSAIRIIPPSVFLTFLDITLPHRLIGTCD